MPNGALRILGTCAKTGWLTYYTRDGTRKEFVSPEVLFDERSLNSLQGISVTLHHPPERMDTFNFNKYAVGFCSTQIIPRKDEGELDVVTIIHAQKGIDAILKDGIKELSLGYDAEVEKREDGEYEQKFRLYNHLSIVDRARAGRQARLHIDGYELIYQEDDIIKTPKIYQEEKWRILTVMA